MRRRQFLKLIGGASTAVLAAPLLARASTPLYIPAARLDYGVPKQLIVPDHQIVNVNDLIWDELVRISADGESRIASTLSVPMLLLHDEYMAERGGRLKAGSVLLVDQRTAERWTTNRVAVPAPGHEKESVIAGRGYWGASA
ncbi:MAG TPA: hypothetical protein VIV12_27770 [Streptosporangiaceae bacterium]